MFHGSTMLQTDQVLDNLTSPPPTSIQQKPIALGHSEISIFRFSAGGKLRISSASTTPLRKCKYGKTTKPQTLHTSAQRALRLVVPHERFCRSIQGLLWIAASMM
ncbi:hypothetical protein ACYU03_11190 [Pseudomonas sp. X10]